MSSEHEAYGLTQEEAEKTQDIIPTYNLGKLGEGDTVAFKIVDAKPREIEFKDKDSGDMKKDLVLTAIHRPTGVKQTLWLSSKSLRMQFWKIARARDGSLSDAEVLISVRTYEHDKWGSTRAYVVQENTEPQEFGLDD